MDWVPHSSICILKILILCLIYYNASGLGGLMTSEEKAKLYAAIGYSETAVDPTLPKSVSRKLLCHKTISNLILDLKVVENCS